MKCRLLILLISFNWLANPTYAQEQEPLYALQQTTFKIPDLGIEVQIPEGGKVRFEPQTSTSYVSIMTIVIYAKYDDVTISGIEVTNYDSVKAKYAQDTAEDASGDALLEPPEDFNNAIQAYKNETTGKYYDDFSGPKGMRLGNHRYYSEPSGLFCCDGSTFVGSTRVKIRMFIEPKSRSNKYLMQAMKHGFRTEFAKVLRHIKINKISHSK